VETESSVYQCGYCGEMNHTFVDLSQGSHQSYIEDCQVCCRPNVLRVTADLASGEVSIAAEFEG